MIEKGNLSPFLFPKKFVNVFTKNLDDFRLTNIFLDFFRNLVYTLDTLKKK